MALPTITLISPENNLTTYNTGIGLTVQYDDIDVQNSTIFLIEIDIVATFNSPRRQYADYGSVATGTQKTLTPAVALTKGIYYWRAKVTNASGTTISAVQKLIVEAPIKRILYQYENVGKYGPVWNKKRILYNYENIAKLNIWTKKRAIYNYENITGDPPFPIIDRLSMYRANQGGVITIYGNGFGAKQADDTTNANRALRGYDGDVYIGMQKCGIVSWVWTEIKITIPEDAVSGAIKVVLTKPDTSGVRTSNLIGFEVVVPESDGNPGLELFICDKRNPNQIIAQLNTARDKTFQDLLNAAGAGSFSICKQTLEDQSLLTNDNYVLCKVDGISYFKWIIENIKPTNVGNGDRSSEMIQVSGRGVLSLLDRAVVYPSGMPTPSSLERVFTGQTAASIFITLIQEAQARRVAGAEDISWDFTGDADTLGNPWNDAFPLSFHAGINLLQVVEKFTDGMGIFDISISPTLKISAYISKGTDVSDKIIFRPGQALLKHESFYNSPNMINAGLIEGSDGAIVETTHEDSISSYGRKEGYLQARSTPNNGLSAYGQMMLETKGSIDWGIEVTLDWNYNKINTDFFIGDLIRIFIPAYDNNPEQDDTVRVRGYTIHADNDTGAINLDLSLNNIYLEKVIKIDQMQEKLSLGSASPTLTNTQEAPVVTKEVFNAHNHEHGSLSGLTHDDHKQYLTIERHANEVHDFIARVVSIRAQGNNDLTGAVTLIPGNNITLTENQTNKTLTFATLDTAYQNAVTGGYTGTEAAFKTDLASIQGLAAAITAIVGS